MPEFPGGSEAMVDFFAKNLKFPSMGLFGGTIIVSFVVEHDGTLSNKRIKKGIAYFVDREVLAVADKMPNWNPGACKGSFVPVEVIIPIKFNLN